jgi:hypothetical protein
MSTPIRLMQRAFYGIPSAEDITSNVQIENIHFDTSYALPYRYIFIGKWLN